MTKNLKKNYSWKFFYIYFWSKTAIYLSLGLHQECPSYRRSLQLSKEAIQHFKTWTLTNFFLLLWVIFALLDPDPESGSGSTDPIESGSNPDPDPQPWPGSNPWHYLCTFGIKSYLSFASSSFFPLMNRYMGLDLRDKINASHYQELCTIYWFYKAGVKYFLLISCHVCFQRIHEHLKKSRQNSAPGILPCTYAIINTCITKALVMPWPYYCM